ncbi:MAG: 5'-3' exonuclease H3TH domain-containing protein, partial [Pseudomonadales bacterium]
PINGVRGYLVWLGNLLRGQVTGTPVRYCAAAFDESLTTCWRNDLYPAYKANRPPADENIGHQLDLCRSVTAGLGVPVLADLQWEADDFIATLARRSRRPVVIVSRDKDLKQLLREEISLLDPKDGSTTDHGAFRAELGFAPTSYPDYQALTGDSVDNVPGVPGVGPKSAGRLIGCFGTLEALYDTAADWSAAGIKRGSRMAERLEASEEAAFLYRRILRLDDRVPLPIGMAETRWRPPPRAEIQARLGDLGLARGLGSNLNAALGALGD